MGKIILAITVFFWLVSFPDAVFDAASAFDTSDIKEHIKKHLEKVKISNPKKYQERMETNRGNIHACIDCHEEEHSGGIDLAPLTRSRN